MTTDGKNGSVPQTGGPVRRLVWDLPVRIFHWTLVGLFAAAWYTAGENGRLHAFIGYALLGLIVFRVYWGFVGTRHALFRDFVTSPFTILAYLRDLFAGRARHYLGHNPAGGAMVMALLLGLSAVTATGALLLTRHFFGVEWMEHLHEWLAYGVLLLVPLHILGVIISSRLHGENLIGAMLTGYKRTATAPEAGEVAEHLQDRVRASEAFAVFALLALAATFVIPEIQAQIERSERRARIKQAVLTEAKPPQTDHATAAASGPSPSMETPAATAQSSISVVTQDHSEPADGAWAVAAAPAVHSPPVPARAPSIEPVIAIGAPLERQPETSDEAASSQTDHQREQEDASLDVAGSPQVDRDDAAAAAPHSAAQGDGEDATPGSGTSPGSLNDAITTSVEDTKRKAKSASKVRVAATSPKSRSSGASESGRSALGAQSSSTGFVSSSDQAKPPATPRAKRSKHKKIVLVHGSGSQTSASRSGRSGKSGKGSASSGSSDGGKGRGRGRGRGGKGGGKG